MNDRAFPNQLVLSGISPKPPSLIADDIYGVMVAWMGPEGEIFLGTNQSWPVFKPEKLKTSAPTSDTPAIALVAEWGKVYVAWTDDGGKVHLINSGDEWEKDIVFDLFPGVVESGPALMFESDLLYIAWRAADSYIIVATCDHDNNIKYYQTGIRSFSKPSLGCIAEIGSPIYMLTGGTRDDPQLEVKSYSSNDKGQTFEENGPLKIPTIGPPTLGFGFEFIAWADLETSCLNVAQMEAWGVFDYKKRFSDGCHEGCPALARLTNDLVAAWTCGADLTNPNAHHIIIGTMPLDQPRDESYKSKENLKRYEKRAPVGDCPNPLTVWDPVRKECVPRISCWGYCVVESFTGTFGWTVFNPLKYAYCVAICKERTD